MFVDGESAGDKIVSIGQYTVGINVLYFRQNIEFVKTLLIMFSQKGSKMTH